VISGADRVRAEWSRPGTRLVRRRRVAVRYHGNQHRHFQEKNPYLSVFMSHFKHGAFIALNSPRGSPTRDMPGDTDRQDFRESMK
jgi:hypothetical protein